MASSRILRVDQLNGNVAVLSDDEGRTVALPLDRLPKGVTCGCSLTVPCDGAGTPTWSSAKIREDDTASPANTNDEPEETEQ